MTLTLADLLAKGGIAGPDVLVMRHAPAEPLLRRAFPMIARERGALLDAYQGYQSGKAQAAIRDARWMISCSGEATGQATFIGAFRIEGFRDVVADDLYADPHISALEKIAGGWATPWAKSNIRLDLREEAEFASYCGRLVLGWSSPLAWFQWLQPERFPIVAILPADQAEPQFHDWRTLWLTFAELKRLPRSWWEKLAPHPAVYLITDSSEGRSYVGSAGGEQNHAQRWQTYAPTGHGGNVALMGRDAEKFRFSIIERLAPDASLREIVHCEERWKRRLMTREFGLNGRDPADRPKPLPEDDTP